ncbi:MAG: ribosome biogenesis GTPase Der [Chthoniobacterales bacterium]|nr:ribosome biogenesis GTPase Der [Chthoniobacterales bacterium]
MKRAVLVGRPNVGKSALFNRLAGRRISIVHDQPGVTRDRIEAVCRTGASPFGIVDTGGIGAAPDPDFAEATHRAADDALDDADAVLFVVDGKDGLLPLDRELAAKLRRASPPVILVVNKLDTPKHDDREADFTALGFSKVVGVSAAHDRGMDDLLSAVQEAFGEETAVAPVPELTIPPRIVIIGRPNVGKSSLTNALLGDERAIVSDIAGTTRDALEVPCELGGRPYLLLDTAGIRHRSKHSTSVEVFSVMRSEEAIRMADVCVLVVDAAAGVTEQDKRIAGLIQKARKAVVVVVNKADLLPEETHGREGLKEALESWRSQLFFLPHAPLVLLSAKTGDNLRRLGTVLEKVRQHATRRLGTGELNRVIRDAMTLHPPPAKGTRRLKVFYATQLEESNPRPFVPVRFLLFVNSPGLLTPTYETYLIAQLRRVREYPGIPVLLDLRARPESEKRVRGRRGRAPETRPARRRK